MTGKQYIITEEHLINFRRGTITFQDIEEFARTHPMQSADDILDDLERRIGKHIIPVGFGGKKMLNDINDQISQMRSVYKTLRKGGEG